MTDDEIFAKLKELTDNGKSFFVEKQNSDISRDIFLTPSWFDELELYRSKNLRENEYSVKTDAIYKIKETGTLISVAEIINKETKLLTYGVIELVEEKTSYESIKHVGVYLRWWHD